MRFIEFIAELDTTDKIIEDVRNGLETELLVEAVQYIHRTTPDFRKIWNSGEIPMNVRDASQRVFQQMAVNPLQVNMKTLETGTKGNATVQVKIGDKWRALAAKDGNVLYWYWIGPREELNNFRGTKIMQPSIPAARYVGVKYPKRPVQQPLRVIA